MERMNLNLRTGPPGPEPGGAASGTPATDADRALWAQFTEASTPEAFCRSWLALQCRVIEGVVGGLVLLGSPDRGPFSPVAVWPDPRRSLKHLTPSAERALAERRGLLLHQAQNGDAGVSGERYDVAYPIEVAGRLHGVVVLEVSPRPERELQIVLRQLHWGAAWLEVLVRREQAATDAATQTRLQTVLDLVATPAGEDRFYAAATAFVTALATRLDCDRVSLGVVQGGRVHVRAVSHSAAFGKHTNLIRAIGSAMDEALDQQAPIVFPAPAAGAIRVTRAHTELARQAGAGAICSVPLSDGDRIVGLLTLERPAERPFDTTTVEMCEAVGALAGPLLELKRRDDRWLFAKAAEAGRTQLAHLLGPRHVALKLSVLALAGIITFVALAQGDYRVTAKTVLEPTVRRAAVAPFTGFIAEGKARAGDRVRTGQVLAVLDDRDLRLERLKWLSQEDQFQKQAQQALATRNAAQVEILRAQVEQARAQLALVTEQLARTQVVAPFAGIVVEGDLSQKLGAPVERGQVLFEVAPLEKYRVILQVDERDVADVALGQRGHLALAAFPSEPLPVTVEQLTPVSTAQEGRNYFRVEARLDASPERLRPGMEGVSKVEIGRRRLIWIWTHEVIDWVRLALWRWMP